MSRTRRILLLPLVAALTAGLGGIAQANPFPNNYDSAVADGALHDFCTTTGFTTDRSVATYAMATLDDTTDMTDSDLGGCTNLATDVWWWQEDLPAGLRGQRSCASHSSPGVCDSSDVKLDYAELDIGDNDWYDRRKTSVHELGHSVGLGHDTISAMISGEVPSTDLVWRRYSPHDIGHINAQY
ncbi:hypothetical protein JOF41_004180 [Saccharothrix coeruleofusca]|uniref:hypothetical protein n=1 Tax=Saccharothrix coeruleofusca TaxID=33919 RepID=UPI001AE2BE4E|nr:hypothetical protein [Saccharothrix coeruleofusca]MBP2338002.1 hypothetical protein [Saccharothrix coeruleofusca]